MTPRILSLIGAIVLLIFLWAFTLWVIYDPPNIQQADNINAIHGADAILTKWNGEQVAYRFDRKKRKYIIMWKRAAS